jgi:hypothetical protein
MVSITRHRGAGRRALTAVSDTPTDLDDAELVLTPAQQEHLTVHGFGPAAVHADFGDPAVRARLVELLRECGALAPTPVTPLRNDRPRRSRRHLRRAG